MRQPLQTEGDTLSHSLTNFLRDVHESRSTDINDDKPGYRVYIIYDKKEVNQVKHNILPCAVHPEYTEVYRSVSCDRLAHSTVLHCVTKF